MVHSQEKGIAVRSFRRELLKARLSCFVAQLGWGVALVLTVLALVALLMALVDWAFALNEEQREAMHLWLPVVGGVLLLPALGLAVRVAWQMPRELDELNNDPRRTITGTLSLPDNDGEGLNAWLGSQARRQAADAVLLARRRFPALRRWLFAFLVPALVALAFMGLYSLSPLAFTTLAARILRPQADVPPYSPWRFVLIPSSPEVHYGESLAVACRVEGDDEPFPAELCLLLRSADGTRQSLSTFRAQDGSHVRVLEKVTAPCEVAFGTPDGRARSHFVPVKVNYSPRILSGRATITPLPYTGEPATEQALGGSELKVPDGGTVSVRLLCSSDIVEGYGEFTPAGSEEAERIPGRAEGNTLLLELQVRKPGTLSLQVKDAHGREADVPVQTRLAVLPDIPPSVSIHQPEDGTFLVAGHALHVEIKAEDDYGLSRFTLYKALAPYRQHGISELGVEKSRHRTLSLHYDTGAMGLRPGDVLELRAEVSDESPYRFSIVSTPTTTINIISRDEYAELLRMELSYEEFLSRYEELEVALAAAMRALEQGDAEAAGQALERARQLAATFAEDFPVFDMDGAFSELSARLSSELEQGLQALAACHAGATESERRQVFDSVLDLLRRLNGDLSAQSAEAQEVALLVRVQEVVNQFQRIVQQQAQIVELFARFVQEFGSTSGSEPGRLEGLGAEQQALRQEYANWEESLSPLLAELGKYESLEPMYAHVFAMRHACEQAGVEGLMDQAVDECSKQHPADAHYFARQALLGMQQLSETSCSQGSCNSASSKCRSALSNAACSSLQQLLDAMNSRNNKPGQGAGSDGGYSLHPNARGNRLLGPQRSRAAHRSSKGGDRSHSGGSDKHNTAPRGAEQIPAGNPSSYPMGNPDSSLDMVPADYHEAVRRYFSH